MKQRTLFLPILVLFLSLISCSDSDTGLFFSLEQEKEIEDSGKELANNLTVTAVAVAPGYYFVSAAGIKRKQIADNTVWQNVAAPEISDGDLTLSTSVAYAFGKVYAAYYASESGKHGLYSSNPATITWARVAIAGTETLKLERLIPSADGSTLFVTGSMVIADARENVVFYSTDGTTFSRVPFEPPTSVIDAEYDGTDYWFLSRDVLYSTAAPATAPTPVDVVSGADDPDFGGIIFLPSASKTFLSARDGFIFINEGSGAWTKLNAAAIQKSGETVSFSEFGYFASAATLFVGTNGSGYYEIKNPSTTPEIIVPVLTAEGFTYSSLSESTVRTFAFDETEKIIFAGTAGNGLWKNIVKDGGRIWQQE